ncbi:MAG: hypothetical protein JXX28_01335 [Deltaproteobacteria bacterium]|nr:hypothetical protein [Deltaproteobacteria bacterium]
MNPKASQLAQRWKTTLNEQKERELAAEQEALAAAKAEEARRAGLRKLRGELLIELAEFGKVLDMGVRKAEDGVTLTLGDATLGFAPEGDEALVRLVFAQSTGEDTITLDGEVWQLNLRGDTMPLLDQGLMLLGTELLGLPPLDAPEAVVEQEAPAPRRAPYVESHPKPAAPHQVSGTSRPSEIDSPTSSRKASKLPGSSLTDLKDLW